jgi:uncharacterized repeat protein (TIGR03943 family)
MERTLRILESGLLAGMGVFMAVFAWSDRYWQFINPKYAWLTFIAGVLITLVALAGFSRPQRRPRLSEILSVALFLGIALTALLGPSPFDMGDATGQAASDDGQFSADGFTGGSITLQYDDEAKPAAEIRYQGRPFTRINLAELLNGEDGGWVKAGDGYAFQGMVLRSPELDKKGYIAVGRLFIFCCFADAVGVTALVKVDQVESYTAGTWVNVLGILREGDPLPGKTARVPGAFSSARSDAWTVTAVKIEKQAAPGIPFMLEVRDRKPFAY